MENFPLEYSKPFELSFMLLKKCNIAFFDDDKSFFQKNWRFSIILPSALIFYLSCFAYTVKLFTGVVDFIELAYIVPVFVVSTQGLMKLLIIVVYKDEVKRVIIDLGSMWRMDDLSESQVTKKNVCLKKLNLTLGVLYWLNIIGTWQYILVPFFETLVRIFLLKQDSDFLFAFYCIYPFDRSANWFTYIAVYAFEGYGVLREIFPYLGAEFLMLTLCAHLSTDFAILNDDLVNAKPENDDNGDEIQQFNDKSYTIRDVVIRHQKLIRISGLLDEIFNKMIFVNLLFATITICMFGFVSKIARTPTDIANNFVGVVASMLPIFTLCYYGELLSSESLTLADSAYQNIWYNRGNCSKKTICIIMKRSQKPCCLTSLKYAPITLNTFTTVLSTTWSYFSLANTMYDGQN